MVTLQLPVFPGLFLGFVGPRIRGRCTVLATVLAHPSVSSQCNSFARHALNHFQTTLGAGLGTAVILDCSWAVRDVRWGVAVSRLRGTT